MIKMFTKKRKGFTLIELIVVIAILGILAAIAVPRFTGMQQKAENQSYEATATTILNAAEISNINGDAVTMGAGSATDIGGLVAGGYLRSDDYTDYTLAEPDSTNKPGEYTVTWTKGTATTKVVGN